ncbi:MAG: hypothetical protein JXB15_02985 [Anaerolineales bacterium]|nr:hypothetical protein [Anaerolineales bacterium]
MSNHSRSRQPGDWQIGRYRPIYLWAGPGTIRMNRLKFMNCPVDETVHMQAHQPEGAERVLRDLYCNWVHLTYDWGFPPEVEAEDWQSFAEAAEAYHQAGSKVFAYFQSSNCVYQGSFREKDWYALDPKQKRITYFTYGGRFMACLGNEAWRQHLREMISGAILRGADGIFLDNLFHGSQPLSIFGAWLGSAGCYCAGCRQSYRDQTGKDMPEQIDETDPDLPLYLQWRADQVTGLVAHLAEYADQLKPGIPISANDFDPVMRNSYLVYGIDLAALAKVQDITMIENYGLPRWESQPRPRLANNALTLRTARTMVNGSAHLSVLSYDVGIGFDGIYPPRRYKQGIAEACALGVSMTTKGTEYNDGGEMTLLTSARYAPVHDALHQYHTWIETNRDCFASDRENQAPLGLLYLEKRLWLDWHRLAPLYFALSQALTCLGLPWQVVRLEEIPASIKALLVIGVPEEALALGNKNLPVVQIDLLEGWYIKPHPVYSRPVWQKKITAAGVTRLMKLYSEKKLMRQLMDGLGLQKIVTQSPFYNVPGSRQKEALLQALPQDIYPRVESPEPVLVETWQAGEINQIHLVNYAAAPQRVKVILGKPSQGWLVSPESPVGQPAAQSWRAENGSVSLDLDIYQILNIQARAVV